MAKFYVTFMLLAIIALETTSIYNHIYAYAHPRYDTSEIGNHQIQYPQQKQHHHRHLPHSNQHHIEHRTHRKRHSELQIQPKDHRFEQEQPSSTPHERRHDGLLSNQYKSIPRLWQHLEQDEKMYGDEPSSVDDEIDKAIMKVKNDISETRDLMKELSLNKKADDHDDDDDDDDINDSHSSDYEDNENDHRYNNKYNSIEKTTVASASTGCPKCESNRQLEQMTKEELTGLRIEYVKQQILGKLRLQKRPNVSAVHLPRPLYEGTTIEHAYDVAKDKDADDYYARTSKKFIFLEREHIECQRLNSPAMCFSFKLDDADADGFDVNTAVLWIFKNKHKRRHEPSYHIANNNDTTKLLEHQTIVVSEVQQQSEQQYLPVVKTIALQTLDVQDEWMKIDIVWPIKSWFGNHELSHLIHISCESCDINSMDEIISVDKDYRPFIMVDTQNRRRPARTKRSINCTNGVTECCREKLYISFDEIGWGDWIIQPRGYDAYFCRGACTTAASITDSSSHHNTFVQKLAATRERNGRKPLELIPCCTAKQYSSLQMVFLVNNTTATQKTFPNMVVESCGCR